MAEWLRRRPAKPMGSPRVGSNPTGVDFTERVGGRVEMKGRDRRRRRRRRRRRKKKKKIIFRSAKKNENEIFIFFRPGLKKTKGIGAASIRARDYQTFA